LAVQRINKASKQRPNSETPGGMLFTGVPPALAFGFSSRC